MHAAAPRPIVPLTDLGAADLGAVGGKGANLGELLGAGLPVPAGFVVTTAVYDAFVASAAGLDETITSATTALDAANPAALAAAEATIAAAFDRADIDPAVATAIVAAYEDLADHGTSPPAVAVRSSATAEDLPGASFAGQQETLLGVRGAAAVVAAVQQCWRSLWTGRAIAYRQQQGSAVDGVAMAVVVQRMVEPVAAGVLFTADPVIGDRSRMIVEAVPGRGEALVQGSRTSDRYVVDHFSGHVREELPADPGSGPLLDSEQVRALHALARRAEAHFGQPQDLEWAIDTAGEPWLLQARPITTLEPEATLPPVPRPPERAAAMLFELFPEGIVPLDMDFVGVVVAAANPVPEFLSLPPPLIRYGQVPLAPDWKRFLLQLPLRLLLVVRSLAHHPDDWYGRELPRLQGEIERFGRVDPAAMDDTALVAQTQAVVAALRRAAGARWLAASGALIRAAPALVWSSRASRHPDLQRSVSDLLAGLPTVTNRINSELADLAADVQEMPVLRQLWATTGPATLPEALARHPEREVRAFGDRLASFLRRWGLREDRGVSVRLPPWEAQSERVVGLIEALAAGSAPAPSTEVYALRQRTQEAVERIVAAAPVPLRGLLRHALPALRTAVRLREDSHYYIFALAGVARRSLIELGGRWQQAGWLKTDDEIFLLRLAEIAAAAHGDLDVAATVRARRPVWAAVRRRWREWQTATTPTGDYLRGVGASPGRAAGPARIILDPAGFGQLRPGEVLIAPATGPAWTPLFRMAAAVVTETGGAMSHAAIVAREYGLPGVMAVPGVTNALRNGEHVLVDGSAGIVQRLADS